MAERWSFGRNWHSQRHYRSSDSLEELELLAGEYPERSLLTESDEATQPAARPQRHSDFPIVGAKVGCGLSHSIQFGGDRTREFLQDRSNGVWNHGRLSWLECGTEIAGLLVGDEYLAQINIQNVLETFPRRPTRVSLSTT